MKIKKDKTMLLSVFCFLRCSDTHSE